MSGILITGGTGAFGKAFISHILDDTIYKHIRFDRICIYSRDEWKQAQMRDEFQDDQRLRFFIGDVRDQDRLRLAMEGSDVVIAAAALKRIEVGNYAPDEMVKTNVLGAMNTIRAAQEASVRRVVALSTDKAYQPISPYGQSKALAESLFLNANNTYGSHGPKFACVRYGNVWNSTGSVVPRWKQLIASGVERVPVTDTECTRFFMTMEQACALVMNTLVSMEGGELVIPKDLPAYRLGELTAAFGIGAEIIGLPAWEKKHECMEEGNCSNTAKLMSYMELQEYLKDV